MHEQGTEGWFNDRCGYATGSRLKDVLSTGKAREDYKKQCAIERLTGEVDITSHGKAGDWGTKMEPIAGLAYEQATGLIVRSSGFIKHPDIPYFGISPDGLIDDDGGQEIKCPIKREIHFDTLISGRMPIEHTPQVQGSMSATGRDWWDFVSYNPRFPKPMRLFIKRIRRDDNYIFRLEEEIMLFNGEVQNMLDKIIQEYKL